MSFVFIIELIGTAAFAFSGGMVAIKQKLDLLGILILGGVTAVGGGLMRDIILGVRPPYVFQKPVYLLTACITVLLLFFLVRFCRKGAENTVPPHWERTMNVLDAVGLGAFTVIGINTCMDAGFADYHVMVMILGVTTGVGGGILRDIMAGLTPTVLRKHVYASASIAGALACMLLWNRLTPDWAMVTGAVLVVVIRLLASHYQWNLPRAIND
ncbi:trimeric intracellular cation channel family protein [Anaerolentibacter hominis]|uniref:trimeric intracellular cation channel family protein n=1 Tax=Anaerolentibacter hominis TaxID=3079009 RepID=UPI0031B85AA1